MALTVVGTPALTPSIYMNELLQMKRILFVALAVFLLAGCDFFRDDGGEGDEVLYFVTAASTTGDVAVEYVNEEGTVARDTFGGLEWSRSFLAETAALHLSAQNLGDSGLVRTLIFVDDDVVAADSVNAAVTDSMRATVEHDL